MGGGGGGAKKSKVADTVFPVLFFPSPKHRHQQQQQQQQKDPLLQQRFVLQHVQGLGIRRRVSSYSFIFLSFSSNFFRSRYYFSRFSFPPFFFALALYFSRFSFPPFFFLSLLFTLPPPHPTTTTTTTPKKKGILHRLRTTLPRRTRRRDHQVLENLDGVFGSRPSSGNALPYFRKLPSRCVLSFRRAAKAGDGVPGRLPVTTVVHSPMLRSLILILFLPLFSRALFHTVTGVVADNKWVNVGKGYDSPANESTWNLASGNCRSDSDKARAGIFSTPFVPQAVTAKPDIMPAFYTPLPNAYANGCAWLSSSLNATVASANGAAVYQQGVDAAQGWASTQGYCV